MIARFFMVVLMLLGATGWLGIGADFARISNPANSSATAQPSAHAAAIPSSPPPTDKQVLGATAIATEATSGLSFVARVDTGARTCSLHAEQMTIENGSPIMEENIGKTIRFLTSNRSGESVWIERPIAEVRWIKTSEKGEWRYLVPLMLTCHGTRKEVLVSLNERSHMNYPMLLGRNLLAGEFLVDVDR